MQKQIEDEREKNKLHQKKFEELAVFKRELIEENKILKKEIKKMKEK